MAKALAAPFGKRRADAIRETAQVCEHCRNSFYRKRLSTGELEDLSGFYARRFCSRTCVNEAREPAPIEDRFWIKVDKRGTGDCWNWKASTDRHGYGQFLYSAGHLVRSHRLAWTLTNGKVPDGFMLCHKCDNRLCCNPSHLFIGTAKDNTLDMVIKGRANKVYDTTLVKLIQSSKITYREAKARYGIGSTQFYRIKKFANRKIN